MLLPCYGVTVVHFMRAALLFHLLKSCVLVALSAKVVKARAARVVKARASVH